MEDVLMKLAKKIETKCGKGECPCAEDCYVYTYEECINRIVDWFKMILDEE